MLATSGFEGWTVTCDRCGRTREQAVLDCLRVLEDEAAEILLALKTATEVILSAGEPEKLTPAKIHSLSGLVEVPTGLSTFPME